MNRNKCFAMLAVGPPRCERCKTLAWVRDDSLWCPQCRQPVASHGNVDLFDCYRLVSIFDYYRLLYPRLRQDSLPEESTPQCPDYIMKDEDGEHVVSCTLCKRIREEDEKIARELVGLDVSDLMRSVPA